MNKLLALTLVLVAGITIAHAQSFNPASLQALQQQVMSNPATQQAIQQVAASPAAQQAQTAIMQKALQQAAANPQLVTQMANSLTPMQQMSLMQQAMAIGQKIFTPAEQAKLTAFTATPEGASIASKLPLLAQQMAPMVLQMYANAGAAKTAPATTK